MKDLAHGSTSMDPVASILKDESIGGGIGMLVHELRDKPLIRCEKCTKCPEDIGENVKFMQCSVCKAKLNFAVHYCSQYVPSRYCHRHCSHFALEWYRACQKDDWREHKKICGKKKSTKQLLGTTRDHFWRYPSLPDYARHVPTDPKEGIELIATGFGNPHPSRPRSHALQRQVSLLTGDKHADYFLFDELDRPVRFVISDLYTRITFRQLRSEVLTSADPRGLGAIAEYLVKMMEHKPGLSRERIVAQLSREYSEDIGEKIAKWGQLIAQSGHPGTMFLEMIGKGLEKAMPTLMNLHK
jgi:hypothetical protein